MGSVLELVTLESDGVVRPSPDVGEKTVIWKLTVMHSADSKVDQEEVVKMIDLYYYHIKNQPDVFIVNFGQNRTGKKPFQVVVSYTFKVLADSLTQKKLNPFTHRNIKNGEQIMAILKTKAANQTAAKAPGAKMALADWPLASLKAACNDLNIPESTWKNVGETHRHILVKLLSRKMGTGMHPVPPPLKLSGKAPVVAAEESDEMEVLEESFTEPEEEEDDLAMAFDDDLSTNSTRGAAKGGVAKPKNFERVSSMPKTNAKVSVAGKPKAVAGKPKAVAGKPKAVAGKPKGSGGGGYPLRPEEIVEELRRPDGRVNMKLVKNILQNAGKWEAGSSRLPLEDRYAMAARIFAAKGKAFLRPFTGK